MKRIIFLIVISCVLSLQIEAQQIKYSMHTLAKGETLSMLANKYNTTVGDIMRMNGMHADSKLVVGQKIKIPEAGKAVPKAEEAEAVKNVPPPAPPSTAVTSKNGIHVVAKAETLYSISKKYGITVDQLKQWNNIPGNNIEIGESLAVTAKAVDAAQAARLQKQKEVAANTEQQNPAATESKPENVNTQVIAIPGKTVPEKQVETAASVPPVSNAASKTEVAARQLAVAPDGSDNFFAKDFNEKKGSKNVNITTGSSGVFKTASGWDDKKFYILMNDAPTGSVVKVKSASGSTIYAKVLWPIDDIQANDGLQFRISDAAASALGITDQKFGLTVQYH